MALKGFRSVADEVVHMTLWDVAEPGHVLCFHSTVAGSGANLGIGGGSGAWATLASNPSGFVPVGVLLQNFVNIDQTKQHRNFHKNEQVIGEKADIMRKGWCVSNKVSGSPAHGNKAYLTTNGNVTPTKSSTGGLVATPYVGEFDDSKDENGYVRWTVNLPNAAGA